MKFDLGTVNVRKANRLPHWDVQHGIYFVTFGLFDAVPRPRLARLREEAAAQAARIEYLRGELTIAEKRAIDVWVHAQSGLVMDESLGSCFLRDPRIAAVVADTITKFDVERYRLLAWSLMPNHVHVVFNLNEGWRLDRAVHSWKSFTAKAGNHILGRKGVFWQDGYYDRTIRDSRELAATVDYVLDNPVKAGLRDWLWVRAYPERLAEFVPPGEAPGGGRAGRSPS